MDVTAVDPAAASIGMARRKPWADRVRWLVGDATTLPPLPRVDLVTMTGNVAQVFLTDEEWESSLNAVWTTLRPGCRLVFEVRDPAREDWRNWTRERSFRRQEVPGIGVVENWVELTRCHAAMHLLPVELRLCGGRRRAHLGLDAALQGAGRDRRFPRGHGLRRRGRAGCPRSPRSRVRVHCAAHRAIRRRWRLSPRRYAGESVILNAESIRMTQLPHLAPGQHGIVRLRDVEAALAESTDEQQCQRAQGLAFEHASVHGLAQRTTKHDRPEAVLNGTNLVPSEHCERASCRAMRRTAGSRWASTHRAHPRSRDSQASGPRNSAAAWSVTSRCTCSNTARKRSSFPSKWWYTAPLVMPARATTSSIDVSP